MLRRGSYWIGDSYCFDGCVNIVRSIPYLLTLCSYSVQWISVSILSYVFMRETADELSIPLAQLEIHPRLVDMSRRCLAPRVGCLVSDKPDGMYVRRHPEVVVVIVSFHEEVLNRNCSSNGQPADYPPGNYSDRAA